MLGLEVSVRPYFIEFLLCAGLGLATEEIFIGVGAVIRSYLKRRKIDWQLPVLTNLWSVPVYGLSAVLAFYLIDVGWPGFYTLDWWWRGLVFVPSIYACEFVWGYLLERLLGKCPWEYRPSEWRIWRYINPAYAPFWFGFGFVLEHTHLDVLPRLLS